MLPSINILILLLLAIILFFMIFVVFHYKKLKKTHDCHNSISIKNKKKIFYFDTSAINYLFDDSKLPIIRQTIKEKTVIYLSVFNIAELASTSNEERRFGLLKLSKEISGGYRPLAMPGDLLRRSLEAVNIWAKDIDYSMGPEWEGVWIALNDPGQIDEETYQETIKWKKNQEEWYQRMHDKGRPRMQKAIKSLPPNKFYGLSSSFSKLLRYYWSNQEFVIEFVYDLASRSGAAVTLDRELIERIIQHSEHWRFFLSSMVYGMYLRSVRTINFGRLKNPGSIDTQQAIYLTVCDTFVTADRHQHRMLRLLVPFGHKKRQIWDYDRFAKWVSEEGEN